MPLNDEERPRRNMYSESVLHNNHSVKIMHMNHIPHPLSKTLRVPVISILTVAPALTKLGLCPPNATTLAPFRRTGNRIGLVGCVPGVVVRVVLVVKILLTALVEELLAGPPPETAALKNDQIMAGEKWRLRIVEDSGWNELYCRRDKATRHSLNVLRGFRN